MILAANAAVGVITESNAEKALEVNLKLINLELQMMFVENDFIFITKIHKRKTKPEFVSNLFFKFSMCLMRTC